MTETVTEMKCDDLIDWLKQPQLRFSEITKRPVIEFKLHVYKRHVTFYSTSRTPPDRHTPHFYLNINPSQTHVKQSINMAASADTSKPYIPLTSLARDGWSTDEEATATCFCGAVQLAFVSDG